MADATVSVLMTAEESRLHQAVMNAAAAFAQLDTGVAKVAKSSRDAAKEEEALGRAARRVFDETRTPQEQYNARMEKLNALVKAGVTDQETFRRAAGRAGDELKGAGGAGVEAFGSKAVGMVKEFAGALGIGFGLAGAIQLVKQEWQAVVDVQNRALEATTTNAAAQRKFRAAAGFESNEEAKQFDEQIEKMAGATGVQGKELYLDAAKAFAVRHGQSKETAMQAVGTAAELFPADADKRQEFTQAILGVTQATGMKQRQAAGWLMASAQRSGIAPPDIAPLINALPGEDPRQVMALAQAVGASMGMDPTRAVLGLAQGLAKGVPAQTNADVQREKEELKAAEAAAEKSHQEYEDRVKERRINEAVYKQGPGQRQSYALRDLREEKEERARMGGLKAGFEARREALATKKRKQAGDTTEERLAYVQAHPELLDEIIEGMALRGPKAKTAVRQLLSGQGATYDLFRQAQAAGISPTDSAAALDKQLGIMGQGGNQLVVDFTRRWAQVRDSLEESGSAANTTRAIKAAIRKDLTPLLEDLGESAFGIKLSNLGHEISPDFVAEGQERLKRRAESLRHPVAMQRDITGNVQISPRKPDLGELEQAGTADKAAKLLEMIHEELMKLNAAQNRPKTPTLAPVNSRN